MRRGSSTRSACARAHTAAALFLEADEQSPLATSRARQRFLRTLHGEVIGIFDTAGRLRFNTQLDSVFTPTLMARVRRGGTVVQRYGDRQVVGICYRDNQGDFRILVAAEDYGGQERLAYLRLVSAGVLLGSVVVSFVLGRWFARNALAPISQLVHQAQRVSAADLRLPLPAGEANDELGELSATLNLMLQRLMVPTLSGTQIPLRKIAKINLLTGPSLIFRDDTQRFIAIKFSVRGRDMGSTIEEAQRLVNARVPLPKGYAYAWAGDFENQQCVTQRLAVVVPISLLLIFFILFVLFGNMKDAGLVLLNLPFAITGGIAALLLTHTNFSISAGSGFTALFGICIQDGVILITVFKQNIGKKMPLDSAIYEGITSHIRPVLMTAMMAAIGLLPAALSTGIGSQTQKPLAIVVIGGLITSTVLTLFIFPLIFERTHGEYRHRQQAQSAAPNTLLT